MYWIIPDVPLFILHIQLHMLIDYDFQKLKYLTSQNSDSGDPKCQKFPYHWKAAAQLTSEALMYVDSSPSVVMRWGYVSVIVVVTVGCKRNQERL